VQALGARSQAAIDAFSADDRAERAPIGRRFARFLARTQPGPCAELCALEAAITHAAVRPLWVDRLDPFEARDGQYALAPGVEIVMVGHDVVSAPPGRVARARQLAEPRALLVLRRTGEPVDVLELPAPLARALTGSSREAPLPADLFSEQPALRDELLGAGVITPTIYEV
jgi:hypothetical protein